MATIKGKWQFTNDAMRIKDHPIHYCEQAVNFTAAGIAPCTSITFDYSEADLAVNISLYIPEIALSHLIVNPGSGAIADAEYAQVDFGNTPQEVSEEFLGLMNLVAVPTNDDGTVTLNGKYVVSPAGIGKIFTSYYLNSDYSGPPTWKSINYTDMKGRSFNYLGCYNSMGLGYGSLYFGKASSINDYSVSCNTAGFSSYSDGCQIIDFGQKNQNIDAIFYGEVLRYALIPYEEGFVDATGLATMVPKLKTKITNQITAGAKNAKAGISSLKAYSSSSTSTSYSNSGLKNYDMLFLIATPSTSSTQVFLTIPMQSISSGAVTEFYVAAGDNTNTTYFKVTATGISVLAGYNQNAASASAGYIKGLYGLKIGG